MNAVQNTTLNVLGTGSIADGLIQIKSNLTLGLILVVVGIAILAFYEYVPTKP